MKIAKMMLSLALALGGVSMMTVTSTPAIAKSGEVRIQTRLTGGSLNGLTPSGSARFRLRGGASDVSVEVEDVRLPNGTVLTAVAVRGGETIAIGSMTVNAGFADIELNSKDGAAVPQLRAGDVVIVSSDGAAILSGALR